MTIDKEQLKAEGWRRLPGINYTAALGPCWLRVMDGAVTVGLQAQEHLANDNLGIVHGGALLTFADIAFGCAVGYANGMKANFVTAQLQFHFTAAARVGQFITCTPEVVRMTSSLAFVRGLIVAEERTVASADGMFKFLDSAKSGAIKTG